MSMFVSILAAAPADTRPWLDRLWLKPNASDFADWSDELFMFIMWVCIISFVALMVPMCYWCWKWRRRAGVAQIRTPNHNTVLEVTWIVVPLIVVVFMFFWGFHGYIRAFVASSNAEIINVTGQKWFWSATYANGAGSGESVHMDLDVKGDGSKSSVTRPAPVIAVPAGRPVKFILTSTDVIHSFYIPDARIKCDVFPNRTTALTFTPKADLGDATSNLYEDGKDRAGSDHYIFCAEYCGQDHSEMHAILRILPEAEYQKTIGEWANFLDDYGPDGKRKQLPMWELGKKIRELKGCVNCHAVDDTKSTGPSWKGSYGTDIAFADGSKLSDHYGKDMDVAWRDYIRESLMTPGKHIHAGYLNQMSPYPELTTPKHIDGLVAYFRHLNGKPDLPPSGGAPPADKPQ